MYTTAVIVVFAVWLLLTCLTQKEGPVNSAVRRWDPLSLLPRWTFFAPNPGTTDHHLLYRDRIDEHTLTHWREIPLSESRSLLGAFWNPGKRNKKALTDAANTLLLFTRTISLPGLKTTLPYIALMNYVSAIPRSHMSEATQFLVLDSFGYITETEPRLVVRSEFHALPARAFVAATPWDPLTAVAATTTALESLP
ncbi:MAG TPA: hypothetical protein VLC46_06015 [Thermoanaerobaculia bacterium]|jgi:hypothetical protein|nr:hypothetical protein [Thermoanaerobaculia bacterium]